MTRLSFGFNRGRSITLLFCLVVLWPVFTGGLYAQPQPSITTPSPLPDGMVGAAYSQTLSASGGTPGYTWLVAGGSSLPAGLSLSGAGVLSGTPTAAGSFSFTLQARDSGTPVRTGSKDFTLKINPQLMITTVSPLSEGTVGAAYSQTLGASGGTPGYTWSVVAPSSLPAGLSLSAAGVISGMPTTAGTFGFTVQAADSSAPARTTTKGFALKINPAPPAITTSSPLPGGTVGGVYSQTLSASGGTPVYSWSVAAGSALPAGLSLSGAGGLSGTPTAAGSFTFTLQVSDSSTPVRTAQKAFTLTINPAPVITTTSPLPEGTVGTAYSQTLAASGGVSGYTWLVVAGSLPGGLSLSGGTGVLSGTPTTAGSVSFTVQATDSSSTPVRTAPKEFTLKINPPLTITTASPLSEGAVGGAYSQTLGASGGVPGYTWSVVTGSSLPAGLSLSGAGVLSGTPTTAGSFSFTLQVRDSSTPVHTVQKAFTLTVNPPPLLITASSPLAVGTAGAAYSQTLSASGGTSGYTWSVAAGSVLPAGLSLSGAGVLSGTPTAAGSFTVTLQVSDSSTPVRTTQKAFGLTINPAPLSITTTSPIAEGAVGTAYSLALAASGGTPGYNWSIAGSLLPAGVNLSAAGVLNGIPATAGSFSFTVQVTDSGTPAQTVQKAFSLTINAGATLISTSSPLPEGLVGAAYSQTLTSSGGTPGYAWSVVAGAVLPPGLSLSGIGVLSGTPTTAGSFTFTIRVTDSSSAVQAAQKTFSLTINAPPSITTASPLLSGTVGTVYSQTLAASGGMPHYTWALAAGSSLPPGLSLSSAGVLSGTPTTAGSFTFTIDVTDSSTPPQTAQKAFNQTINSGAAVLSITTLSPLPSASVGTPYSPTLTAGGGTPGYTWSVAPGSSLPAGLSLSGVGVLGGTPTTDGSFNFVLRVTDSSIPTQTAQKTFDLTINRASASPSITTVSPLNAAVVGTSYSQTLTASGGTPGYTWSLATGSSLPAGLSLSGAGVLSGTPTAAGSFSFTIRVTDSSSPPQTANGTFVLLIDTSSPPSLTLNNLPSQVNPTQQLGISLALAAPYSTALSGTLRISFTSRAVVPLDDPMVLFSTGSRTVNFTIPANGTVAVFPSPIQVLTGTVAGTVTLMADIPGRASQLVGLVDIRSMSPQLGGIAAVRTPGGLRVAVTGYSTERRVQRVEFAFRVRTGSTTQDVKLTRDVEPEFDTWYRNTASSAFGSSFVFTQSFAVQGDSTAIEAVTVTLTNGQGSTSSAAVPFSN